MSTLAATLAAARDDHAAAQTALAGHAAALRAITAAIERAADDPPRDPAAWGRWLDDLTDARGALGIALADLGAASTELARTARDTVRRARLQGEEPPGTLRLAR